jgi:flagella basal body P-ring formation protein FlgA
MTCSRRSTTWFASVVVLLAAVAGVPADAAGVPDRLAPVPEAAVRQAVVDAVRTRMGSDVDVRIEGLRVGGGAWPPAADAALVASPEPGARLGRPVRFTLSYASSPRPLPAGYAVATIFVEAEHARAARSLSRGESLAPEDVIPARTEVGAVPLQRLPKAGELTGRRVVRDMLPDEVLTHSAVAQRPMVQSGDAVTLRVFTDGVLVQTRGVAAQSGEAGDTVRVVNPESRRSVKARVVAPATVEVIQ